MMNRAEVGVVNSPPWRWLERGYVVPVLQRSGAGHAAPCVDAAAVEQHDTTEFFSTILRSAFRWLSALPDAACPRR